MRNRLHLFVVAALLACLAPRGLAQTASESAPATGAGSALDESALAFEPLRREFVNLFNSLRNKGGFSGDDGPLIQDLHERVMTFRETWPDDLRALAVDYQLSTWLNENDRAEVLFFRLVELMPENQDLRLGWAAELKAKNRYAAAIEAIETADFDLTSNAAAALLLAQSYFAEHRFQDGVDVIEGLSEEAIEADQRAKSQVATLQPVLEEYVALWAQEQETRKAEAAADDLPRVEIITDKGRIVVELFENDAPNTVANFIVLADQGFYDGTTWHRVIPNFMTQGGDPNTKEGAVGRAGAGNPGYFIPDEHGPDTRKHFSGSLAMAKQATENTAGCQFYLTHEPPHWLNGKHTVFGRVVEGQEYVVIIERDDVIQSVKVLRKRDHPYEPRTLPAPDASTAP